MQTERPLINGFASFTEATFQKGETISVTISAKNANGTVHADAVQLLPIQVD